LAGRDNSRYVLVQFHPSYGYEDFIDGIRPVKNESGSFDLRLENGTFKKICKKAFEELEKAKEENREAKKYYFIADEINRAELSRVFGELLLCLEDDKRLRYDEEGNLIGVKIKTQNSNLWEEEHCIIEENGEYFFGISENLYFIGTMNEIDRSVDSFDMALRRRFTWVRMSFDEEPIRRKYGNHPKISDYINACYNLNKFITVDKSGFNLGADYELGHSYFLKPNDLNQDELDKVWDKHIAPLLTEYLRAFVSQSEIIEKLKDAKKKFKI
jgi:5-methylcytosine-specific restriction endonuclease McrBC GTP-binding regulatory subunit McrB